MCILCVIQKWSRRVATILPWLVLPLIGLWALSQMLPPAFRFEITSPRLACVFVLLVTLFWYEILMPKLSAWRAHQNARLRERKRNQAIELQKLRKTATRKCRNCLTPYRDQNPCGGKFMCSYCGHISKRPVLDLPVSPGMAVSNSGIIKELVGKGGKLLNGRVWSENGWMCPQEWRDNNGNCGGGGTLTAPKPVNWRKNANGLFGGDEHCLAEKSYSGVVIFACKLLTSFFLSIRWLWRKIFSGSSSSEDTSLSTDHSGILSKRGECIGNFNESRSEKTRRKAEEKRQARIEKVLLEEEERKQREEVARLVEERRKLRDVKMGAEKATSPVKDKASKREAEKKRQERRKERDRGSSKSNSDAEELEKRVGKEAERKQDFDKRNECDGREHQNYATDIVKGYSNDIGRGPKNASAYNVNRGGSGARYLDRMRNNLLSSSKAFSGTNFFGRTANSPAVIQKESKLNSVVNHVHSSAHKKEVSPPERIAGKSVVNGIPSEPQPQPAPKKSWQQLFTRSTPVHPSSSRNSISRPNTVVPSDVKSPPLPSQTGPASFNDKQINFGLPSLFPVYSLQNGTTSSSLGFSPAIDPIFPRQHDSIPEERDLFEDPCYVPDPALLLGPVSELLENFQLDLGSGFISDIGLEKPRAPKIPGPASEISRPSPIESPMSRLRGIDDRHSKASCLPGTPKLQDKLSSPLEDEKAWQLWGPSPLGQDGSGLIGGSAWHQPNRLSKEEFLRPSSLFAEDHALPSTCSPQKDLLSGGQNCGALSRLAVSNDKDPWVEKAFIPPLSDNEKHFPFKHQQQPSTENEAFYGSPTGSAPAHPFMLYPADSWSKKEWGAAGPECGEHSGNQSVVASASPQIGDVFPPLMMYSHFGTQTGK